MLNVIRQSQMLAHFNSCWHLTAAWDLVDTSVLLDQRGSKIHLLRASFVDPLDRPAHVLFTVFESHFDVFPTFLQLSLQWRQRKNAYRISLDKRVENWNLRVLICLIHAWNRKYPRKEFQISNVKRNTLEKRWKTWKKSIPPHHTETPDIITSWRDPKHSYSTTKRKGPKVCTSWRKQRRGEGVTGATRHLRRASWKLAASSCSRSAMSPWHESVWITWHDLMILYVSM